MVVIIAENTSALDVSVTKTFIISMLQEIKL